MRKEIVADVIKETARELAAHRCQFDDLNSSIAILEARKKLHPEAEDLNLFLLLSNEIYELKKRIKELEGKNA